MTTHLDIEKERRDFEAATDSISECCEFCFVLTPHGTYKDPVTNAAWLCWLAARSASLPPVAAPVSQQDASAPDFCPECHLQASMPDREEMAIVGRKLANWLFGLSVAQAMPDVWRKTCAELVAAWNVVAGEPAPAGSAKGGNTQPQTAARASLQADEGKDDALKAARYRYIEDNASTHGGGKGFTITCFVPVDHEDMGCGIDAAIAAKEGQ
jgi:hypothetical protein